MSSNISSKSSSKPPTKFKPRTPNKSPKTVAFDQSQILPSSQNSIPDSELQTLVQLNSTELQNSCISQLCPQTLIRQESNGYNRAQKSNSNQSSSIELGLSSGINNTVVSIYLSPLSSVVKAGDVPTMLWKLKNKIEDKEIETFYLFAESHQLQIENNYNKCLILKKKKPRTMKLFNCLMFKSLPQLALKIQIFDRTDELKISHTSGVPPPVTQKQDEFNYYFLELKKLLFKNNLVKFDEIQSINLFIQTNSQDFADLLSSYRDIEKSFFPISPCTLETIMQATIDLRQKLVTLAKSKDQYEKIKIQQFVDRRLFNNLHMFNLYKKAYQASQVDYQQCKEKIVKSLTISMQFEYLEIQSHLKEKEGNPYREAIDELSKLNVVISPYEKLEIIKNMYGLIRGKEVFERRREEDLLPVVIFVVLNSKVNYMYANVGLMGHFLEQVEEREEEGLVSNLYVAVEYISNSWRISENE